MMSGVSRCIAVASLSCGFAGSLGASLTVSAQTSAPPATAPKIPAVAKLEPTPKVLIGTLFNTREQRERLDHTRLRGGVIEDEVVATVEPARPVINGFVKRSDGRNTVWVDDVMKRDPRAEVVGRLEPNVVGGMTRGLSEVALTKLKTKAGFVGSHTSIKHRATKKTSRGSKPYSPRKPIKK